METTGQTTKGPIPNNQRNMQNDNAKTERKGVCFVLAQIHVITKKCQGTRWGRPRHTWSANFSR